MEMPSNRIQALREAADMSRVEVAVVCNVGEATVRRWELGETTIPDMQKFRLAELFCVSPGYLMGWPSQPEAAA